MGMFEAELELLRELLSGFPFDKNIGDDAVREGWGRLETAR